MKPLFFLPILLFFSSCTKSQVINGDNTELHFTQVWVWEYKNELKGVEEPGYQGEIVVYFHPELNYWLFNFESFGTSGEMFEWVLGKPDGTYIIHAKDESGKSIFWEEKLEFENLKKIPSYYKPSRDKEVFNQNDLGYEKLTGKAYQIHYEKTEEKGKVYLTKYPQNFLPLYYFNQLNLEAKLPIHFPLDLPEDVLMLKEETTTPNGEMLMSLKMISNTEYYIYLK